LIQARKSFLAFIAGYQKSHLAPNEKNTYYLLVPAFLGIKAKK